MTQQIVTDRLVLRPAVEADAARFLEGLNDYDVVKWLANAPYPYLESDLCLSGPDGSSLWPHLAIIEHEGDMIGMVSTEPHLGFWLLRRAWGEGFATEAARAMCDAAFGRGVDYIASGFFDGNSGSEGVLAKLGFQYVGESQRWCEPQQKDLPHHDTWLDRSDWETQRT
ncbi:MAG: GNAT family N-acetyltransferase [Pseudomonadota bacterium]